MDIKNMGIKHCHSVCYLAVNKPSDYPAQITYLTQVITHNHEKH